MVNITRVYTGTGDRGETRLSDGTMVPKTHPRMQACGDVDEANSILGMVQTAIQDDDLRAAIVRIQNDLFDLGSDIATPLGVSYEERIPRIVPGQVDWLEAAIDRANQDLAPLTSFILPGGNQLGAWLHMARCVVRRAERSLVALMASDIDAMNPETLRYVNRLSDWCFVQARRANQDGDAEVLWRPGEHR